MAKFFVGQRVRILYSDGWPELRGQEGKIVGPSSGGVSGQSNWIVAPKSWGSEWAPCPGRNHGALKFGPNNDQLEPILPEGAQPCGMSYEEMMQEFKEKVS